MFRLCSQICTRASPGPVPGPPMPSLSTPRPLNSPNRPGIKASNCRRMLGSRRFALLGLRRRPGHRHACHDHRSTFTLRRGFGDRNGRPAGAGLSVVRGSDPGARPRGSAGPCCRSPLACRACRRTPGSCRRRRHARRAVETPLGDVLGHLELLLAAMIEHRVGDLSYRACRPGTPPLR